MTREVVTVEPATTVAAALELARDHSIRHLPVLSGSMLVGVVTDRDLRLALGPGADPAAVPVEDVMTGSPITTPPGSPIESAARLMIEKRIGCLPVVEDEQLVGILTETDLIRSFVDLMAGRERFSRLEILAPDRPGELARVVRLIGIDYGINITGVVVPPPQQERALIVLHLESDDVAELLVTLRRLGYEADSPSLSTRPA